MKVLWKEEKKQELTNRKKEETMGKVFGYPEFDENGEQILTTYDNEYKDMLMDVRVYRMKAGDEKSFQKTGEETAVLLLSGSIEFAFDDVLLFLEPHPANIHTTSAIIIISPIIFFFIAIPPGCFVLCNFVNSNQWSSIRLLFTKPPALRNDNKKNRSNKYQC